MLLRNVFTFNLRPILTAIYGVTGGELTTFC